MLDNMTAELFAVQRCDSYENTHKVACDENAFTNWSQPQRWFF